VLGLFLWDWLAPDGPAWAFIGTYLIKLINHSFFNLINLTMLQSKQERVAVYIDGFNLFYSIKNLYPSYEFVDVRKLSERLLNNYQKLEVVKYFSSRFRDDQRKVIKQKHYTKLLKGQEIEIIWGHYSKNVSKCRRCHTKWITASEKSTDMNLGLNIIFDALDDLYDTALVMSSDTDLVPVLQGFNQRFANKDIVLVSMPDNGGSFLKRQASYTLHISEKLIRECQFASVINHF